MSNQYPDYLRHPALRGIHDDVFVLRVNFFARMFYCRPSEWVNWYGDLIRDTDGGNGMYATRQQAKGWPNKVNQGDITIGPG